MNNEPSTPEPNRAALAMARRLIEMEVAASRPVDGAADLIVEMVASRMRVTDDGNLHLMQDCGTIPMWSDYLTEEPLTVREYVAQIRRDRATLFQADAPRGSVTAATPAVVSVPPIPAGNEPKTLTELMKTARTNPALYQQLMNNAPGSQPKTNLTELMVSAKRGDASALTKLNSHIGK